MLYDERIDKHVMINREDWEFVEELIRKGKAKNFTDLLHHLLINQKEIELENQLQKIEDKLKNMSIEQSTMSEFISDYLYSQQYHDQFVHINHGTDIEAYRNARKVALSRIKDNQEEHTHHLHQQKAFNKKQERIKYRSLFDNINEPYERRSNLH